MGRNLAHQVNKVISNPRWSQPFTIFRTTRKAGDDGRAEVEESEITAKGVIQPTKGEDLDRLLEGDRGDQAITVWTNTPLSSGTDGELADEIEWRGTLYMVKHVRDWGDYGPGFCQAVCVAQDMKERTGTEDEP